jgi:rhamnogalacturonan endolyase
MTIDYNSTEGNIWSIVPTGTQDQLIDFSIPDAGDGEIGNTGTFNSGSPLSGIPLPSGWASANPVGTGQPTTEPAMFEPTGLYWINSGFTAVTPVPHYVLTPSYLDFWTTYPASGVTPKNTTEYEEHVVVTPNDLGIHTYFVVNHPAQVVGTGGTLVSNGSGTIGGQVQWVVRDSVTQFTNTYAKDADLSMINAVITPLPSVDDMFSSDKGREPQDPSGLSTVDLHPQLGVTNAFSPYPLGQIPQGYTRNFYVKYNHAGYEYLHKAHGLFGGNYGMWAVFPSKDTFVGGPQKQNLNYTSNLLTIEPLSDHFTFGLSMNSSGPGTTTIPAGTAMSHLFGPVYIRINKFGMSTDSSIDGGIIQTPDDMYNDAVAAGSSFAKFYDNEATLLASGYVPSQARGSVSVSVNDIAGAPRTAWAVLSQPGVNHQLSTFSYQYWADISSTGSTTFTNVVPGTYRLSVYSLGQWGEYRNDSVVVTAGNTTTVPTIGFAQENFGTVIGTIGNPDRSSHEFLHGHSAADHPDTPLGYDFREYWGNWNYWADFATNPTNTVAPGAVVYNLTDGTNGPATNDLTKWNYTHWASYDPNLYGGAYNPTDDTTDGYNYIIPAYVNTLTGHTGTNGVGTPVPPWQIHFTTPSGAFSQAYVDLSVALSTAQSTYTITINGSNPLAWTVSKIHASDSSERSGLSGFTQWFVMQWPTSFLNPVGQDNVISISVSGTSNGYFEGSGSSAKAKVVANNSDDAIRLELSNIGASPTVTGWNDYEFVTSGIDTAANDSVPNP